jgi:tRNA(adenine34) deaminase
MVEFNEMDFMGMALEQARKGARAEEIPIGAVLVLGGKVMARNHNRCVTTQDPTAHAEILVIREAAKKLRNYRLLGSVLYVTVEPCVMCVGAMIHARISRLVLGAPEEKTGIVQFRLALLDGSLFNHRIETVGGICVEECRQLVQGFFRERRQKTMQPELCLERSGDILQKMDPLCLV